jgi:FkbM family methyltransferase
VRAEPPRTLDPPFGTFAPGAAQAALIGLTRGSFLRRGVTRNKMAALVGALRPGPLDVQFRGANFRLHTAGSPTEGAMLMNPVYNTDEFDLIDAALSEGDVFVDIGANIGLYALTVARRVGQGGRVIAIEPEPTALARLKDNVAANAGARVEIYPCAVGDRTGEVSFTSDNSNLGHSRIESGGALSVPMVPLADLLIKAGLERVDALKIDVEGFEDIVLIPFLKAWPKAARPRLMVIEHVEASGWREDCIAYCLAEGYVQCWKGRSNTVLKAP